MRFAWFIFVLLFPTISTWSQTSLKEMGLKLGKYRVGFHHYTIVDSTRTYSRVFDYTHTKIPRPIPVSIWYPANLVEGAGRRLQVLDYLEILKEEEEWEYLPAEQILNWFYYPNTPANQKHLVELTGAIQGVHMEAGNYPVVIYAPSYQASSIENFALCEFLASHGFLVISSPSRGTEMRWFSNNNAKEMETQARDVEFLIRHAAGIPGAANQRLAIMGFSFGGLSNIIVQNRNDQIRAIASLDGTERYQFGLLNQSPFFDAEKLDVPYLHLAQKDIPDQVLKEDGLDPSLNSDFKLFDSISRSKAYRLKFHNLTHSHFSTLGVLFEARDARQDKADEAIMESYRWMANHVLNFLKATLEEDQAAWTYLDNTSLNQSVIGYRRKLPEPVPFTFQDFNDLAASQQYEGLPQLYDSILRTHPELRLPEGNLNTLGLQLVFNPEKTSQGIAVFLLATLIYPQSANLYDSLAEGYLFQGNTPKAIESFKKSLELNPENQNAINRLAILMPEPN